MAPETRDAEHEKRQDSKQDDEKKRDDDGQEDKDKKGDDNKEGDEKKKGNSKRSYLFVAIFAVVAILAGIGILIYHLLVGRYHVTTKDAYVNGNLVRLQPQVTGTVTLITVDQTQPVQLGQVLVALDPHDAEVSLQQARANLAQTVRDVATLRSAAGSPTTSSGAGFSSSMCRWARCSFF